MARTRTIHCSHCGRADHNRRTCPDLADAYKKAESKYHRKTRARSCSFCKAVQIRYNWRTIAQEYNESRHCEKPFDLEEMHASDWISTMQARAKTHNRRTCSLFKSVVEKEYNEVRDRHINYVNQLRESGIGIGSMVTASCWHIEKRTYLPTLCFVTGVHWGHYGKGEPISLLVRPLASNVEQGGGKLPLHYALREVRRNRVAPGGKLPDPPASWSGDQNPYFMKMAKEYVLDQYK